MKAWEVPVPGANERIEALRETVEVVRRAWEGDPFTFEGEHLSVRGGLCIPAPAQPPRVVVGVGSSRRLLRSALEYADEINVYADNDFIKDAHREIERAGREVQLSAYLWDWPDDIQDRLKEWEQLGVSRAFLTFWDPFDRLETAAAWLG